MPPRLVIPQVVDSHLHTREPPASLLRRCGERPASQAPFFVLPIPFSFVDPQAWQLHVLQQNHAPALAFLVAPLSDDGGSHGWRGPRPAVAGDADDVRLEGT